MAAILVRDGKIVVRGGKVVVDTPECRDKCCGLPDPCANCTASICSLCSDFTEYTLTLSGLNASCVLDCGAGAVTFPTDVTVTVECDNGTGVWRDVTSSSYSGDTGGCSWTIEATIQCLTGQCGASYGGGYWTVGITIAAGSSRDLNLNWIYPRVCGEACPPAAAYAYWCKGTFSSCETLNDPGTMVVTRA